MGKSKDPVWDFVNVVNNTNGKESVFCKHCDWHLTVKNASRAKDHLLGCKKCPEVIKTIVRGMSKEVKYFRSPNSRLSEETGDVDGLLNVALPPASVSSFNSRPSSSNSESGSAFSPPPSPAPSVPRSSGFHSLSSGGTLRNFVDKMSKDEQEKHAANFARAAYATNCPFVMFEHPLWVEAFQQLRPSFKPPKKDAMGGRLLNNEYDKVMSGAKDKINGAPYLGITCDSYKNIKGEGLLNFVVLTPEPVFYETVDLKDKREDSDFIAEQIISKIVELGPDKLILIITDNVSYNVVAWDKIRDQFPHIATIGCGAHSINLLMNDIGKLKSVRKLNTMARVLYKGIKNCRRAYAVFKQEQQRIYQNAHTIKLPCPTRFWGIVILFESILDNKTALQSTVLEATTDPNPKDPEEKKKFYLTRKVKSIALDDDYFFTRLGEWVAAMKPIAHAIESIESDSSLLSEVPQLFREMHVNTIAALESSSGLKKLVPFVKNLIRERKDFACKDIHYAANLVDPRYKGAALTAEEKLAGSEYISNLCDELSMPLLKKQEVLSNLTEFRANAGVWSMESMQHSHIGVAPAVWWRATCEDQPLSSIAVRLLTLPASAAAVERNWSCYGRTHSKIRNRLRNAKTEKLVAIQMNLRYSLPRHLVKTPAKKRSYGAPEGRLDSVERGLDAEDDLVGVEEEVDLDLLDFIDDSDEVSSGSEWEENSDEELDQEDGDLGDLEMDVPSPAPVNQNPRDTRKRTAVPLSNSPQEEPQPKRSMRSRSSKSRAK